MKKKLIMWIIVGVIVSLLGCFFLLREIISPARYRGKLTQIYYSSSGGFMAYEDYLACPNVTITSDLKVTLKPGSGDESEFQSTTYTITQEEFDAIEKEIRRTRFTSLPSRIDNKGCMDGGSSRIRLNFGKYEKEVYIYCRHNKRFSKVEDSILENINHQNQYSTYYQKIRDLARIQTQEKEKEFE